MKPTTPEQFATLVDILCPESEKVKLLSQYIRYRNSNISIESPVIRFCEASMRKSGLLDGIYWRFYYKPLVELECPELTLLFKQ